MSNVSNAQYYLHLNTNLSHGRYDMMNAKISSKHDNMHNNDVNYVLKSSKNNDLSK